MVTSTLARANDGTQSQDAELDAQLSRIDIAGIHAGVRRPILSKYPPTLRRALAEQYLETATRQRRVLAGETRAQALAEGRATDSWAQANQDLIARDAQLRKCRVDLAWDDSTARDMAQQCASICSGLARDRAPADAYRAATVIAERHGIRVPLPVEGRSAASCHARLCDAKWWRRAIRSTYTRLTEDAARELGLVCRRKGLYASDDAVMRRRQHRLRTRDLLASLLAVNDLGECFSLAELSDVNVSNPRIRRAELMTRVAGFERYAGCLGHVAWFVTVTLPSRFHRVLDKSQKLNPRFDGSTVKQGQEFLCSQWAKLRAHLARAEITAYGLRVCEPHHDGTPHWHLVLFCDPAHSRRLLDAFRKYFDPADEKESGSERWRVKFKLIDRAKGSATGYVIKYVAKNIDGFGVGADLESDSAHRACETAQRVDAWASTHGVRQFQQIGGPPVSVWRELRRIHAPVGGIIEALRLAAEDQSWERFCELTGGVDCRADARPVRLHTVRSTKPGFYGDLNPRQLRGLRAGNVVIVTRERSWTLLRRPESGSPWTRVNNCTARRLPAIRALTTAGVDTV